MQALLNYLAASPQSVRDDALGPFADGRDKWVGVISAVGLCALLAGDLISLL